MLATLNCCSAVCMSIDGVSRSVIEVVNKKVEWCFACKILDAKRFLVFISV